MLLEGPGVIHDVCSRTNSFTYREYIDNMWTIWHQCPESLKTPPLIYFEQLIKSLSTTTYFIVGSNSRALMKHRMKINELSLIFVNSLLTKMQLRVKLFSLEWEKKLMKNEKRLEWKETCCFGELPNGTEPEAPVKPSIYMDLISTISCTTPSSPLLQKPKPYLTTWGLWFIEIELVNNGGVSDAHITSRVILHWGAVLIHFFLIFFFGKITDGLTTLSIFVYRRPIRIWSSIRLPYSQRNVYTPPLVYDGKNYFNGDDICHALVQPSYDFDHDAECGTTCLDPYKI